MTPPSTTGPCHLWLAALLGQQLYREKKHTGAQGKSIHRSPSLNKLPSSHSSFPSRCTRQCLHLEGRTALLFIYKPAKTFSLKYWLFSKKGDQEQIQPSHSHGNPPRYHVTQIPTTLLDKADPYYFPPTQAGNSSRTKKRLLGGFQFK